MSFPHGFLTHGNFELAFHRIVRSGNKEYKQFFRPLFPSYELGLSANVQDLVQAIRAGRFQATAPELVFLPKKSGVLRPLSVLSLTDLVVYQGICNVVADAFERSKVPRKVVSYGNVYAGKSSPFFFRSWKRSYAAYRRSIKEAFHSGRTWMADFDLVSFFELIDHQLLLQTVQKLIPNTEFIEFFRECLACWTLGCEANQIRHGLPQGPDASAFLAELLLEPIDRKRFPNCTYLRYVDDIKLMADAEVPVRRALVGLDLTSKSLGLVPQAQKIECREVTKLHDLYKTVPSGLLSVGEPGKRATSLGIKSLLKAVARSLGGRGPSIRVLDETLFKYALYRSPPKRRLLRRIAPLFLHRPDLAWVLAAYASKFGPDSETAKILLKAVDRDPVFDSAAANFIRAMDVCEPLPTLRGYRRAVRTAMGRSQEKGAHLTIESVIFRSKRRPSSLRTFLRPLTKGPRISVGVAPILARLLNENEAKWAPIILPLCRTYISSQSPDLARFAAGLLLEKTLPPHAFPRDANRAAHLLLRAVGIARKSPRREGVLPVFFRKQGLTIKVRWTRVLGKELRSMEQRCMRLQALMVKPEPGSRVLMLDTFNEVLVQQVSLHDPALSTFFRKCCKSGHRQPDYGQWLKQQTTGGASRLATVLPKAQPWLLQVHEARILADLAHAKDCKTGQPTRPMSFRQADNIMKGRKIAWAEILGKLSSV